LVEYGAHVPSDLKTRLEDLINLEDRVKTLEEGGNSDYIIDEIKAINSYVRIDECVNIINHNELYNIPFEMNEKFFQYYRRVDTDNNLQAFEVYVQIYHNTHIAALFSIDKKNNSIHLGYEKFENFPYLNFQTYRLG
jgi:hypothetical protein